MRTIAKTNVIDEFQVFSDRRRLVRDEILMTLVTLSIFVIRKLICLQSITFALF